MSYGSKKKQVIGANHFRLGELGEPRYSVRTTKKEPLTIEIQADH